MSLQLRLGIVIILLIINPMIIQAKEIKYNHNSITIDEIKKKVDFKVLSPHEIPDGWTLELKTYPWEEKDIINYFRLHYMDQNDENLMVGIEQRKSSDDYIDKNNKGVEIVNLNGKKGYFKKWGNSGELDSRGNVIMGGLLTWVQEGTYIEMDSHMITKETMTEIARSMK